MLVALVVGCLAGCSSSSREESGVTAVAPAHQSELVGTAPQSGTYVLYRAVGTEQPVIERIWSANVSTGQKVGFQWVTDKAHQWDPSGGFHLHAFAGGDVRDLGPFVDRDVRYVWAENNADVAGYFHTHNAQLNMQAAMMQ